MKGTGMKQSAFDLLGHGFLPPDRENILFFLKALALIGVVCLVVFIAGIVIGSHFPTRL